MRDFIDHLKRLNEATSYAQAAKTFHDLVANQFSDDIDVAQMSPEQLKRYYRRLSMRLHPDVSGSTEAMAELNDAWDVLKDERAQTSGSHQRPNRPNADADRAYPVWAMAGYAGGLRSSYDIHRNDYSDLNYIKKTMWELSGESHEEWTVWDFDGRYFRGVWTVYGSEAIFGEMAKAMVQWDRFHQSRGVLAQRRKDPSKLYLIWADGRILKHPVELEHDSFNANPGNDQSFCNYLGKVLDDLKATAEKAVARSAAQSEARLRAKN